MSICPFCKSKDSCKTSYEGIFTLFYYVKCQVCEARGSKATTKEQAERLWAEGAER